jgi:hypothetical protein
MRLKLLFIAIALFVVCGRSYGQSIFDNPITGTDPGLTTQYISGQNVNSNISVSGISRGSGLTGNAATNRYNAKDWSTSTIDLNDYFEFTLTPNSGYKIDFVSFVYTAQVSSGTPSFAFRSNLDGYTSNIGTPNSTGTTISLLAGIFQNITTPITYRFYAYGLALSTTTYSINDFTFNGTVTSTGPTSIKSGDWNDPTVWSTGSVPNPTDNATISAAHTVYTSTALTRTGVTIVSGAFELRAAGWASGTNFTYGPTGTLIFNQSSGGSYGVNNGDVFWPTTNSPFNVTNSGQGLTMNSMARTVTGTFQTSATVNFPTSTLILNGITKINADGFFNQSPIFGSTSTLIYNSGGFYGRGYEWSALGIGTIGTTPGYPNNIQLSGNTTLNYNNGTPLAKAINGNLSIDSGSSFYMDFGGGASGGPLTVAGNVTNYGNFTLGNTVNDDLKLGGNFTNTGTFNGNNRAVFFTKAGTQIVTSLSGLTIPYVVFSGGTTVQLATGTNMLISAPNEGNAISFTNSSDVFDINVGNTLTIGTATKANTITGPGTFKGSTSSNLILLGTGSIGTLKFAGDLNLGTLTINRQAATVGCTIGSDVTINTALNLTSGLISLGNFDMSLGLTATNTGSSDGFVVSDPDAGTGKLTKRVDSLGAYTLHIGENTAPNGAQYAPATINFSSIVSFSPNAYYGIQVKDAVHPNIDSPTDNLTKYWIITSSGTFDTPVYSFTGLYNSGATDVNGTESSCISAKWDGTKWINGTAIGGGTLTISGLTKMATSTTNEISAGNRNREINIKGLTGGTNNIANGSSTANGLNNTLFAATSIGSSATKDYEIQNLGIADLNLTSTPIVSIGGANPGDFTVTTLPASTVIGGSNTSFVITFSPTFGGIRTAIVSIANNDSDENPYTFLIQGTGVCTTMAINTITPTSGPIGTEVTITATANNLTGATVSFNGVAATSITYVSSTQIKVLVPSGATSGNLVTTNVTVCQATNTFTIIDNKANTCQGGTAASDLFISEVTDATTGGLSYVEIYNGTNSAINMNGYSLKTYFNGGTLTPTTLSLNNFSLNPGSIYIVAIGTTASPDSSNTCSITGGNGSFANQTSTSAGVNFDTSGNDCIALYKISTSSTIDSFGTLGSDIWADGLGLGDRGATFRRKNTASFPSTTYSNSDWNITDWIGTAQASCYTNDYSDIGTYNFISGTPPTVTTHPSYTPTCKSTTLTVSGTESFAGGNPLTYKWLVSAPNATGWTELSDTGIYTGTSTATLSIANISGVIGYQYYCQIRENSNTCYSASNAVKITTGAVATWNGSWTNGPPTLDKLVIINADYNTATNGDLNACSVIVNAGKVLTVTAQKFVTIQNDLTINLTAKLEVEDKGSLIMINDLGTVTNNGTTNILRSTPTFEKYDYVYWSTPIVSTNIETTFVSYVPNSTDWRIDNAYKFNPANYVDISPLDGFDDNHDDWTFTTSMDPGKGYIIMVPEQKITPPGPPVISAVVVFSGKVNNGVVPTTIELTPDTTDPFDDFNLVGNPYPSAISADAFINANISSNGTAYNTIEGTLYFWTHIKDLSSTNTGPDTYNYSQDDYAVYTLAGGTAAGSGGAKPLGYIASCQGFFIEAVNPGTLLFNNSMRVGSPNSANSQFYKSRSSKSKTVTKDRIWLNLENSLDMFSQQLIGYFDNATLGYDNGYDGLLNDGGNYVNFYSFIDNDSYKIQGRSAFDENDQVRLGYFSAVAGTFNISIDSKEGVFTNLNTPVYLEDKLLNVIYDLKQSPYTFTTEKGTFNDRFILRYTNKTLSNKDFETLENQVLISNKNKQIKVNSAVETIDKVFVYDLLGRQIFKKEKVNSNELTILNLVSSQQTLLVKVILRNGHSVTKKIVH